MLLLLLPLPQPPLCQQEVRGCDVVVLVGLQSPETVQTGPSDEGSASDSDAAETQVLGGRNILGDGVSVCYAPQHHALDDGAVLFLRQAAMGHQRRGQLGGRGRVHPLQPLVVLDLLQGRSLLWVPLQHVSDEAEGQRSKWQKHEVIRHQMWCETYSTWECDSCLHNTDRIFLLLVFTLCNILVLVDG